MTPLAHIPRLFADFDRPYWVAGGWAVDLHLGRVTREHSDVDVLVLAKDLPALEAAFPGERRPLVRGTTGELRDWLPGETLVPGPDTLVLPGDPRPDMPVQIILGVEDGGDWVFHRGGGRIRRALDKVSLTRDGIPYLAPEVVLLFKSRDLRPRDLADHAALAPTLTDEARAWLVARLPRDQPEHPWRA